jgi:hypothetical protein
LIDLIKKGAVVSGSESMNNDPIMEFQNNPRPVLSEGGTGTGPSLLDVSHIEDTAPAACSS